MKTASLLLIPLMCATAAAHAAPVIHPLPLSEFTHPHQLIDVEHGRRLNVVCLGSGSPTVIFEAGGGDDSASFRKVMPAIASHTRVCSYDRAGIGFSDPAPRPSTAVNVVADLHRLVPAISQGQPVVLVGHSDGGLYVPLYAATYPNDVAGMVLIDPFTVGADKIAASLLTPRQRGAWYASDDKDVADARACVELAERGVLTRPDHSKSPCLDNPPSEDPARHALLNAQLARPSEQTALLSALLDTYPTPEHGMSGGELALQKANPSFGDMPLRVLTAGKDQQTDLPKATRAAIAHAWKHSNDELAGRSHRGTNAVIPGTHHYIQNEKPQAVIDAVDRVVSDVRGR